MFSSTPDRTLCSTSTPSDAATGPSTASVEDGSRAVSRRHVWRGAALGAGAAAGLVALGSVPAAGAEGRVPSRAARVRMRTVVLTQSEYDALKRPNAGTLYLIVD